jgi:hypothetical protein
VPWRATSMKNTDIGSETSQGRAEDNRPQAFRSPTIRQEWFLPRFRLPQATVLIFRKLKGDPKGNLRDWFQWLNEASA